ncbi:MAG: phenylacetic acid degradation protein PaaN [Marivibrio sp.]|uniref:phenylacetic acid degradation protein PaaN n=1 Tax=Marivibrio sp. TaxID=2039719 RepID=UPI0032EBCAE2
MAAADYFAKHKETLSTALETIASRGFWSPYPERASGSIYGESAADEGEVAFKARLGKPFELSGHPGDGYLETGETSPYGLELGVTYPKLSAAEAIAAAKSGMKAWRDAGVEARAGVCLEALARINARSFEMAHAVMHTTGQAFLMAFQAGGTHAQDRGLEAVTYAYREMTSVPAVARWEKPQGKNPPLVMDKHFNVAPRGVAAMIGVSTFPTWNGYPGLFASLVTGNPVVVKPHPMTVLPLAISVEIVRDVLAECGFDPNLVTLLTDRRDAPVAKELCTDPAVGIVDFTGSNAFGEWLERNCPQAQVYTEKAGVNALVIDDFADVKGMARNLSFTLSLYSGQMCTTPQNIFVPKDGIQAGDQRLSFDEVAETLAGALEKFLSDDERAWGVLGAIQAPETAQRIEQAAQMGEVVLDSRAITHQAWPDARIRTPIMLKIDGSERDKYESELFGPISFVVACEDIDDALEKWRETVARKGAITAGVYSDRAETLKKAEEVAQEVGVALSVNLTGGVFVNQTAAFSDFHATGANPAANAALVDSAFVANRFRMVEIRYPVAAEG